MMSDCQPRTASLVLLLSMGVPRFRSTPCRRALAVEEPLAAPPSHIPRRAAMLALAFSPGPVIASPERSEGRSNPGQRCWIASSLRASQRRAAAQGRYSPAADSGAATSSRGFLSAATAKRRATAAAKSIRKAPKKIAGEDIGTVAALDQQTEQERRDDAADAGADRVEEGDRHGADFERETLAHRQIGRARGGRSEEEDDRPGDGLARCGQLLRDRRRRRRSPAAGRRGRKSPRSSGAVRSYRTGGRARSGRARCRRRRAGYTSRHDRPARHRISSAPAHR